MSDDRPAGDGKEPPAGRRDPQNGRRRPGEEPGKRAQGARKRTPAAENATRRPRGTEAGSAPRGKRTEVPLDRDGARRESGRSSDQRAEGERGGRAAQDRRAPQSAKSQAANAQEATAQAAKAQAAKAKAAKAQAAKNKAAKARAKAAKAKRVGDARGAEEAATRPLAVVGIVAAAWCAGLGLVVLTTITLAGWIAAPRAGLGTGLPGVFRTSVTFWLVSHHAGFSLPGGGRVGMLPLGLTVLPGVLLFRGGGWITRSGRVRGRYRVGVVHAALALAIPYSLLAFLLALAARSPMVKPSALQALPICFLLALVMGGLGAARSLVSSTSTRSPWVEMLRLLPDRTRSLVSGVTGATLVLLGSGALLFAISLVLHLSAARDLFDVLRPGVVGGFLLLLVELVYLPNAIVWGVAFAAGPGFAVGAGTSVSPSGVFLGMMPSFPPLAALPDPGPAPVLSLIALIAPFLAGIVGGALTMRALPSPVGEAAPLWGFVCGLLTGGVMALLCALSGGPLGGGRMAVVGPSFWQVGLMIALEVGVSAAISAWIANWRLLRRVPAEPAVIPDPEPEPDDLPFVEPDPVLTSVRPPLPEGVIPIEYGTEPSVPLPRPEPEEPGEGKETRDGAVFMLKKKDPSD